jgi:hypothetical protein
MKGSGRVLFLLIGAVAGFGADWTERADQALSFASAGGHVRARVSGTLELEGYAFEQPAPGFIDANGDTLFNPRMSAFLDAQFGSHLYVFAQGRIDRGFDPANDPPRARLDEYAVRLTPAVDGWLNVQAGKFATVVGNWVPRHLAWDNPLITAPLVYENLTGLWDAAPARSVPMLLGWAHVRPVPASPAPAEDKYLRLPVIWGPSYATGAAVSGEFGRWNYAAELKGSSLSSRPDAWRRNGFDAPHPTVSGRIGFKPDLRWNLGVSASSGVYLAPAAAALLPPGRRLGDYQERVLGQDAAFAWHHVQIWAEVFEARYEIPGVGRADTLSYYVETRFKLTPQFFVSARWNEQRFGRLPEPTGAEVRWGADTWRIDGAAGYRFTAESEVKVQVSLQHQHPAARETGVLGAVQFVQRF